MSGTGVPGSRISLMVPLSLPIRVAAPNAFGSNCRPGVPASLHYTEDVPGSDHNPHHRRLYLPLISANGSNRHMTDTHVAHSVGCAQTTRPAGRRPDWLKVKARLGPNYVDLKGIMRGLDLHTVCEEAGCPNIYECWEDREATFLILGDKCTRRCGFCDVMTAKPDPLDRDEPHRVAQAVEAMGLRYVVLTSVARDDL